MKLTDLQQLIDDIASGAMSDALDQDVGIGELSDAASIELSAKLHEIIADELKRLSGLFGDGANVTILISPDNADTQFAVSMLVRPKGGVVRKSFWGMTVPEAITAVEEYSAVWINDNRTMVAADLGLAA